MDVEDVRAMLGPYYALVREQLEQRGGTIEKFIGDAVVAVFGAPAAHEDDPERAVRAALAIREALVELDTDPAAGESFVSGDVVNTASRLQAAAPIDGVLVGAVTYRATRNSIEYEQVAPVLAKGKAAPVQCWRAAHALSRVGETRRHHDASRLVGRERERHEAIDAFELASSRHSVQALTLVGVAGIGKSRLVRELFRYVDRRPDLIRWREGRSPPYGGGGTFWALAEIVKAEAGLHDSLDAGGASAKLGQAVALRVEDHDEAEWVEGHLRTLAGLDGGVPLFGDRRAEAFAAWRRFIERLAEHRPTVLVFEDLHWADDAMLDFIEHLVDWAAHVPLLVLCTARPELLERRPRWGSDAPATRLVTLAPLTREETHELLDELLRKALLPETTRLALLTAAEGNPLYAQEFVRMLVDRRILVQRAGEWQLDEPAVLPVPDSVLGIIAARLDAIPANDKTVIQDAAVVGKVFWPGAVAHVAGRGRWAIEEALRRMEQRQLVRRRHESSVVGDTEYVFEHGLIRDVAYRTIVRRLRAQKHERAGDWMSSLTADPRDRADAVAHHYAKALENAEALGTAPPELRRSTLSALRAAAARADSLHSHAAAARLWGQALQLTAPDDEIRPSLLLAYGRALAVADGPAVDVLEEAAGALLEAGERVGAAEAESTIGWLLSLAGQPEEARARDERALELVRDAPPSYAKALILTRVGAGAVLADEGRPQGHRVLGEALAIAEQLGLREIEAEALQFVGMLRLDAGDAEGIHDIEHALTVARELNSPVSLSCYGNLADMRRYFGSLRESGVLHVEGEHAATRFGMPVQIRRFRAEQAADFYFSGEWDEALAHVEEYLDVIETGSPHRGAGEARLHRGRIRLARGDHDGALEDARAALSFGRATAEPWDLFTALAFSARASAAAGTGDTEAIVSELLDRLAAGQPFWCAWALPDLVAAMGGERHAELRDILESATPQTRWYKAVCAVLDADFVRAAEVYEEIGSQPDEAVARLQAARRASDTGDSVRAREGLARAVTFFQRAGAGALLREADGLAASLQSTR